MWLFILYDPCYMIQTVVDKIHHAAYLAECVSFLRLLPQVMIDIPRQHEQPQAIFHSQF